jgi:hypothetical protein
VQLVSLQQGFPGLSAWQDIPFDAAIVWSGIGERLLRNLGFHGQIVACKHPWYLARKIHNDVEVHARPRQSNETIDVLYIGQIFYDTGFENTGYGATLDLTCDIFEQALAVDSRIRIILRPHYNDRHDDVAKHFASKLPADRFAVRRGNDLHNDISDAAVVIGDNSTALEEALLMGRRVVQIRSFAEDLFDLCTVSNRCVRAQNGDELLDAVNAAVAEIHTHAHAGSIYTMDETFGKYPLASVFLRSMVTGHE